MANEVVSPVVMALVYQVGKEVRACIATKQVGADDAGEPIITQGHATSAVNTAGGTVNTNLFTALVKLPVGKHMAKGHSIQERAHYKDSGVDGINLLFQIIKTPKAEDKPADTLVTTVTEKQADKPKSK